MKFTLEFRDRFNCQKTVQITPAERDKLRNERVIEQKPFRSKQYKLIGVGVEFRRNECGVLLYDEFVLEPFRVAPRELTAIDRLRAMGLRWEAAKLEMGLNCQSMLSKAPCNSGNYQAAPQGRAVLFG